MHVQAAEERIEFLEDQIEQAAGPMRDEIAKLSKARDDYIIKSYEASEGLETPSGVKLTKVVSHTRRWNPDKLRKLLPTSIYKLVIDVSVNKNKLDELVREGRIDRSKIESAYEETPNAPYVKRTKASATSGEEEAASLAAKLG